MSQPETTDQTSSEKVARSSIKRTDPPEPESLPSASSETIDEDEPPPKRDYNFSMSVDELSDMEKEVDEFCNDDDEDDDDDDDDDKAEEKKDGDEQPQPRPSKQQPTSSALASNEQDDEYDSDSSSSQKLRDLTLGEERLINSDEESLGDDEAPRGWKENPKPKQLRSWFFLIRYLFFTSIRLYNVGTNKHAQTQLMSIFFCMFERFVRS